MKIFRKKIRKKSEPRRRKKSKKTSIEGKKDLIIKSTRTWQKKAYVDRRMYEKKYDLSIKKNEEYKKSTITFFKFIYVVELKKVKAIKSISGSKYS